MYLTHIILEIILLSSIQQNTPRTGQAFATYNLPPLPNANHTPRPSTPRSGIDNRPAWQTRDQPSKRLAIKEEGIAPSDTQRKKVRMWVFSTIILEVSQQVTTPSYADRRGQWPTRY